MNCIYLLLSPIFFLFLKKKMEARHKLIIFALIFLFYLYFILEKKINSLLSHFW